MPKTRRQKPLYGRGEFRLDASKSGIYVITWYDHDARRERRVSAATRDFGQAKFKTDSLYVERHGGLSICPTCGQSAIAQATDISTILALYLEPKLAKNPKDAVGPRIAHLKKWLDANGMSNLDPTRFNASHAEHFRAWSAAQPIISPAGKTRERAPGTTENSLIALAAAIRAAKLEPAFTTIQTKELNRTPLYRATLPEIAAMLRYAMEPGKGREALLRFLRASIATWARPDAIYDIDTRPARRQWHPAANVLALNPDQRRQTRKVRATVPIATAFAHCLNTAPPGNYVGVASIKSAWETMAAQLGLPIGTGEAGTKLIRRSIAHIARGRIGESDWIQGRMMLGHHKASTSDIYALPNPAHLGKALAATESIIADLSTLCPGAFTPSLPHTENPSPTRGL